MTDLLDRLRKASSFEELLAGLRAGRLCQVEGLWGSSAAYLLASLAGPLGRTFLVVTPQVEHAEALHEDLELFDPGRAVFFPAWEDFETDELPDQDIAARRLAVVKDLFLGNRSEPGARIIVAAAQAVLQPVPGPDALRENTLALQKGMTLSPDSLAEWLAQRGFNPVRRVEAAGEYCRRGGIIDVFPHAAALPLRVEFFGDELDSLRTFDSQLQSSLEVIAAANITAVARWDGIGTEERKRTKPVWASLMDHLPPDSLLVLKEPAEALSRAESLAERPGAGATEEGLESLRAALGGFGQLRLAALPGVFGDSPFTFRVHSTERFGAELDVTLTELNVIAREREQVIVFCNNAGEQTRLRELLGDSPVVANRRFETRVGRLNYGFDWPDLSLTLLTHQEIFRRYRQRRPTPRFRASRAIAGFYDLQVDDLVVHAVHGIGIFRGTTFQEHSGARQECVRIEYADRAMLFVPVSAIELVQKYIGPAEHKPPLSKLGTKGWLRRKERVEESVRDLAVEMLRIQALREATRGIAHPADSDWQREFEAAFLYEETEDQLRVSGEVKRDMEQPQPMDRLICGDVGYGKTEVAMRAAFKAATGGRQTAVLVPTTVLAAQHTQTFGERMADYPISIEMLSRFRTAGEQERVIRRLSEGSVDIVIGTHRLVQPDVRFKDLGLVIIDEEQRFGVEHKERLKRLRETVDVLTLTATPIPRTLHMSFLGIRDISSLDTPPRDRLAIQTRLMRFDPHRVRQIILHELARDGQVFYVHNRVETINRTAGELRELVPEARILIGHGQMHERELADVMRRFAEGGADMLVCTTIIESGLDIPNANTILIDQADMFGLAELHQLRGRVGRYKHRAYAYMILPASRPMTPDGEKRLKAIEEFCDLGSGFRIAMRDLEIRGAGNILGPEQSGHIAAVGYDMYCRLLEQTVRALKNLPAQERSDVSIALGVNAFLPEEYVPDNRQRIDIYRKTHRAGEPSELEGIRAELRDRFGPLPPEAEHLLAEARLRRLADRAGIASITRHDRDLLLHAADMARLLSVLHAARNPFRQPDDRTILFRMDDARKSGEFLLSFVTRLLEKGLAAADHPAESKAT